LCGRWQFREWLRVNSNVKGAPFRVHLTRDSNLVTFQVCRRKRLGFQAFYTCAKYTVNGNCSKGSGELSPEPLIWNANLRWGEEELVYVVSQGLESRHPKRVAGVEQVCEMAVFGRVLDTWLVSARRQGPAAQGDEIAQVACYRPDSCSA
jgi:hypothetical protein